MRVIREERITHEGIFWLKFILGIIFNWISIFVAGSEKYFDDRANKLKWYGTVSGFGVSIFLYGAIASFINKLIILGIILLAIVVVLIILVYKQREKIYIKAGYTGHIIRKNVEKTGNDLKEEITSQDYQIRYRIEYVILRNLIIKMENDFKEMLLDEQKIIDFLCKIYENLSEKPKREDFAVYYNLTNEEQNVVLKLPKTESTALCNMIGIKVNSKRFFAYSNTLVEWKGIENPMRLYLKFDGNNAEDLLDYISKIK